MKNLNLLLLTLFISCFTILFSCQKTDEEPLATFQETEKENAQAPWRSPELVSLRSGGNGHGYIDQEHLDSVTYNNGLMRIRFSQRSDRIH